MLRALSTLLCGLLLGASAFGQASTVSREQEQVRRLRLQVQQLQQAQAAQQEAAQRAQTDLATDRARLDGATRQLGAAQAALRQAKAEASTQKLAADTAQNQLEAERKERQALQARLDQTLAEQQNERRASAAQVLQLRSAAGGLTEQLAQAQAAQGDLAARHHRQALGLQTCINNNRGLYDVAQDLLQRWVHRTVADVLAEQEPFLGLRRVALENLVQGYQDRLDPLALKPPAPQPALEGAKLSAPGSLRGR